MAARDRYTVNLECPSCKRKGTAEVSEDDYPFMRDLRFSVDEISEGFRVKTVGRNLTTTEFVCSDCGVPAR